MSEDERLREALLELQFLRDREARYHRETRALLACFKAFADAVDPDAAMASMTSVLSAEISADLVLVCRELEDGAYEAAFASKPDFVATTVVLPEGISERARNLADLALLGHWGGDLDLDRYRGTITCPLEVSGERRFVLLALKLRPHTFNGTDLKLLKRVSSLIERSLENKALVAENAILSAAIHGSSAGFAIADAASPDLPIVYVNPAFEAISGHTATESIGRNLRFLSAEPMTSPEQVRLSEAIAEKQAGRFLLRNRRKSGEIFWNEFALLPVRNGDDAAPKLIATQIDVTGLVEAEHERDRTQARFEQSLAATDEGFLILDEDERVTFANRALRNLFPTTSSDWKIGSSFSQNWQQYATAARNVGSATDQAVMSPPDLNTLVGLHGGQEIDLPDGRSAIVRASSLDGGGIVFSATDVTPMKTARSLLQQRLAAIEAAEDGIAISDGDGRLIYANSAAAELLGYASATSALGRMWQKQYVETDELRHQSTVQGTFQRAIEGMRLIHEVKSSPLTPKGAVVVIRDATERLRTEEREAALRRELVRLQRQEATAQLAAGVAHDFNNLLAAINGSASLISMASSDAPQVEKHASRIAAAGARAARMTNRLLDLGNTQSAQGTFDIRTALKDLPSLVSPSLPGGVELKVDPVAEPLLVRGDSGELSQAVVNLVFNAVDAIGQGKGSIHVRINRREFHEPTTLFAGSLPAPGSYVQVEVADTGKGMPAEVLARATEPYFSTKGGGGTGLGLAIVKMQVGSIGGGLDIQSAEGSGTQISLYWPLADNTRVELAQPGSNQSLDLTGLSVLVVDDEAEVAEVVQSYLEAFGAEVSVCIDPKDALEAIVEDPDAWSVLLADYDMPGMSGGDLVDKVDGVAPEMKVFIMTALARRLSDPRLHKRLVQGVLPKPLDLERLCNALEQLQSEQVGTIDDTCTSS